LDDDDARSEELRRLVAECLERTEEEGEDAVAVVCAGHPALADALQEPLGRPVALKLIRREQLLFADAHERFRREAVAAAQLQHPGIVPIHAAGEEDGIPYIAMELVHGCTLADVVRALRDRPPAGLAGGDLAQAVARCTPDAAELDPSAAGVEHEVVVVAARRPVRELLDRAREEARRAEVERRPPRRARARRSGSGSRRSGWCERRRSTARGRARSPPLWIAFLLRTCR